MSVNTPSPASAAAPARPGPDAEALPFLAGEEPWTAQDVTEVRAELQADIERIAADLRASETELEGLMHDYGGGAGDDSADTGGKVLEREQGLTLTNNSRTLLQQSERAVQRLADGTYGVCESCAQPIGKMRLQAFPRATLCVSCKQKQERR